MSAAPSVHPDLGPRVSRRLARIDAGCIGVCVAVSLAVMIGWIADWTWLTGFGDQPRMTFPGAVAGLSLCVGFVFAGRGGRLVGLAAIGAGATSGLATFLIQIGVTDGEAVGSVFGAFSVAVLGLCRIILDTRFARLVEWLADGVLLVVTTTCLGYLYRTGDASPIATLDPPSLPAAVAIGALGMVCLARVPHGLFAWGVVSSGPGATLVRRLAPWVLVGLPLIGYGRVLMVKYGNVSDSFGVALTMACVLVLGNAALLAVMRAADVTEDRRQDAVDAFGMLNVDLEERVQERADQLEIERGRYAVLNDRQRIAADMHDHVIQGLYGVALMLDSAKRKGITPEQLDEAVRGVDTAIRDLRTTIYDLKHEGAGHLLEDRLAAVCHVAGSTQVNLVCRGPVAEVSDAVAENVLASAREAISNALRHGRATCVQVRVEVAGDTVLVVVEDDGVGMDADVLGTSGMKNIRSRAERYGGECRWEAVIPHGTRLVWRSPCHPPRPEITAPDPERVPVALTPDMIEAMRLAMHHQTADGQPTVVGALAACVAGILDCDRMLVLADRNDALEVIAAAGTGAVLPLGRRMPKVASLSGQVVSGGHAVRIENIAELSSTAIFSGIQLAPGPGLLVPLGDDGGVTGVLALGRVQGGGAFGIHDVRLARTLASYVDLAVEMRAETSPDGVAESGTRAF